MAEYLALPKEFNDQGWEAKVQDKERNEEPHLTLVWRKSRWRWGLRRKGFMDKKPDPKAVPGDLVTWLTENQASAMAVWDKIYPDNPVESERLNG